MTTTPTIPTNQISINDVITFGAAWNTLDLSTKVPAGTTAVIIRMHDVSSTGIRKAAVRPYGNTEDYSAAANSYQGTVKDMFVALDGSYRCEAYIAGLTADRKFSIVWYTNAPSTQFDATSTDISPTADSAYHTVDLTAGNSAALCEVYNTSTTAYLFALRVHGGSFDQLYNLINPDRGNSLGVLPLDVNGDGDAARNNVALVIRKWGYLKGEYIQITPTQLTFTGITNWETIDASAYLPAGALGVVIQVANPAVRVFSLRKNGSTDLDPGYVLAGSNNWFVCGVDADRKFQVYANDSSAAIPTYVIGYFAEYTPITADYTKGDYADLPTDDAELENAFTGTEITNVSSDDDTTYADQSATGQYAIFEFKENATDKTSVTATWDGKSSLAPSSSTVYLQVYNRSGTPAWETIDSENGVGADTDFTLQATLTDLTNYKEDVTGIIAFRVYQLVA